jgi:hypothetical protein
MEQVSAAFLARCSLSDRLSFPLQVNEDVLNAPANPLLVVNQRLQLTLADRSRARAAASAAASPVQLPQLQYVSAR